MSIRTRRWTRSPRGCVLGVATGLAEWRGLPVDITRFVVFLLFLFTAFFPALMVYLIIAVIHPEQTEADIIRDGDTTYSSDYAYSTRRTRRSYSSSPKADDATFREKSTDDLEREYEELKKKVESMESDVFDKEKEWDARFKDETNN